MKLVHTIPTLALQNGRRSWPTTADVAATLRRSRADELLISNGGRLLMQTDAAGFERVRRAWLTLAHDQQLARAPEMEEAILALRRLHVQMLRKGRRAIAALKHLSACGIS